MKTESVFRSETESGFIVSTIRFRDGRKSVYETSIGLNGRWTDGVRSSDKVGAAIDHDKACDFLRGRLDKNTVSFSRWESAVADLNGAKAVV